VGYNEKIAICFSLLILKVQREGKSNEPIVVRCTFNIRNRKANASSTTTSW
jgi:hypothetical protein